MKRKSTKALSIILAAVMLLSCMAVPASAAPADKFTDVPEGSWYYDAVEYALWNGIFQGTSATTFAPNAPMTRGQFVTVLGRNARVPITNTADIPFTDVKTTDYFYPYVSWAYTNKIVNGTSATTFSPGATVTRQEIAVIFYRHLAGGQPVNTEVLSGFPDSSSIASWAIDAMAWAVENGVLSGSGGKLNPKDKGTRAQVAQIMYNIEDPDPIPEDLIDKELPSGIALPPGTNMGRMLELMYLCQNYEDLIGLYPDEKAADGAPIYGEFAYIYRLYGMEYEALLDQMIAEIHAQPADNYRLQLNVVSKYFNMLGMMALNRLLNMCSWRRRPNGERYMYAAQFIIAPDPYA